MTRAIAPKRTVVPPNIWKGTILNVDPNFDPAEIVASYGYKHEITLYKNIPDKIRWVMGQMNSAQAQVFIRRYGLDGQKHRTIIQITEELGVRVGWVTDRKREIDLLLEKLKFGEILRDLSPLPIEETSAP